MELIYFPRRRSITTGTGTGNLTLASTTGAWLPIDESDFGGDQFAYVIAAVDGTEWEEGLGHLDTGNVLVRDTVMYNSAGDSLPISFSAGTKDVFCTFPADAADGVSELCEGGFLNAGRGGNHDTTDATPLVVSVPFAGLYGAGETIVVEVTVLAQASTDETKAFRVVYMVVWDGAASTMYGKSITTIAESESLPWTVDVALDGTQHELTLTGESATDINWRTYVVVKALGNQA